MKEPKSVKDGPSREIADDYAKFRVLAFQATIESDTRESLERCNIQLGRTQPEILRHKGEEIMNIKIGKATTALIKKQKYVLKVRYDSGVYWVYLAQNGETNFTETGADGTVVGMRWANFIVEGAPSLQGALDVLEGNTKDYIKSEINEWMDLHRSIES